MRSNRGSLLLLTAFLVIILIVVTALPLLAIIEALIWGERVQAAVNSAGLSAANDLSRIVINDPHYGFISLSDYPANGLATFAADNEPLPVTSLNGIMGTCRYELLVAERLQSNAMRQIANEDIKAAREAESRLSAALCESMKPMSSLTAHDRDGNEIRPYSHALQVLKDNLAHLSGNAALPDVDLDLQLGWRQGKHSSLVPIPQPEYLAEVEPGGSLDGCYKAFSDSPLGGESFRFAEVAREAMLVDTAQYMPADGNRFCSVLHVQGRVKLIGENIFNWCANQQFVEIVRSALVVPPTEAAQAFPVTLTIRFPDGLIPSVTRIRNLLERESLGVAYLSQAHGGDYPDSSESYISPLKSSENPCSVQKVITRGFLDWLKAARGKARLDDVLALIDSSFENQASYRTDKLLQSNFLYSVRSDGTIGIINEGSYPFLKGTVNDNQLCLLGADVHYDSGGEWTMNFRDQVAFSGRERGGAHGGQLMVGNPINWLELPYFGGMPRKGLYENFSLLLSGDSSGCAGGEQAVSDKTAKLMRMDGKSLKRQLRKSSVYGGLAVEISFTRQIAAEPGS